MSRIISADIGTTAAKVALVELSGNIVDTTARSYPLKVKGSWAEQNPQDWWTAFCGGVKELMDRNGDSSLQALVLSGQMQDLIRISQGEPKGDAILYSDTRARKEWTQLAQELGEDLLIEKTRNLGDPAGLPGKLLWLKSRREQISGERTMVLLGAADFICWKLTNRFVTDYTNGSTTGLMNFDDNRWDPDILQYLGISELNLPELVSADEIVGTVSGGAAVETGLPNGIPVIHGTGDAGSVTIGAGAGIQGIISCYLGTSGWVAVTGESPVDPTTGIFNLRHPDGDKVLNIGPMLMAGGNVEWALRTFLGDHEGDLSENAFELYTRLAAKAVPGSGGIFYLPYLMGERSPFRDPDARGAFIGMGRETGRAEMFRAVLEGISYSMNSILGILTPSSQSERMIYLSGGGAENPVWAEILASVTESIVVTASSARETGILGNTVIAGRALGLFDSYGLPPGFLQVEEEFYPEKELVDFYRGGMEIFNGVYPALKETFRTVPLWLNK